MKSSREQAKKNRELVLDSAARLFRECGIDGISVSDIMKAANLTHGGFYGHFASKDDLAEETCERGLARAAALWQKLVAEDEKPLQAILGYYLTEEHRDQPGSGCFISALAVDVARQGKALKRVFTRGLEDAFETLARVVGGRTRHIRRREAIAVMSQLVGAMILARTVDDPELSEEILKAARADLLDRERAA